MIISMLYKDISSFWSWLPISERKKEQVFKLKYLLLFIIYLYCSYDHIVYFYESEKKNIILTC